MKSKETISSSSEHDSPQRDRRALLALSSIKKINFDSPEVRSDHTTTPFGVDLSQEIIGDNRAAPGKTRYDSGVGRDGRNVWDWAYGE